MVFNRLYDSYSFNEAVVPNLTSNAQRAYDYSLTEQSVRSSASDPDWYGTTDVSSVMGTLDTFLFTDDLNRYLEQLRSRTVRTDIRNLSQKKKIQFTEQEKGVFSFDLAALGLVKVYEYYSPLLNKMVSANLVRSIKVDGKLIFYHILVEGVPEHKAEWKGGMGAYYSNLLKKIIPEEELIKRDGEMYVKEVEHIAQHEVERRQKVDENGKPVFSSTWKKSFIHIPKVELPLPTIDLIVSMAYNSNVNARTQMIWGCMAAVCIAEKLQQSGVRFRMYGALQMGAGNKELFKFVKIKDVAERINTNGTAILLSDARNFRYNEFKNIIASFQEVGWANDVLSTGIAYARNDSQAIKSAYISFLEQTGQYDDLNAKTINAASKIVFETVYSEQGAITQYNQKVNEVMQATQIP